MLVGGADEITAAASGFLLARCAGKDRYFPVLDAVFRGQQEMVQTGDVRGDIHIVIVLEQAAQAIARMLFVVNDQDGRLWAHITSPRQIVTPFHP